MRENCKIDIECAFAEGFYIDPNLSAPGVNLSIAFLN